MATDDATFSGHPFTLRLTMTTASQSVTTNKSTINWSLKAIKTGAFTPYTTDDAATWAMSKDGSGHWGPYNFSGSVGQSITVASGSFSVTHTADGSLTFSATYSAHAGSTLGTASGSMTYSPPDIPRATQPSVSPTSGTTDSTYTITDTAASSSFYHDIDYSLDGGTTWLGLVANQPGTTTTNTWTPASSMIPNQTSVTAIIRTTTYSSSGGTVLGTKTVNLPLTIPSTVKPSVSSVAWSDAQTGGTGLPNMPTLIGAFVQRWSLLKPVVTALGTGGASIASSTVTMAGQTVNSGSAFAAFPGLSGSCAYSANATDSRGVPSDPYTNVVAILAYNNPNLPVPSVVRTSDAAGTIPSTTGTYLAITPAASVSDLTVGGTQKNVLEWQVETAPAGSSTWTVQQAWTNASVSGNTWTTKKVIAGFSSASAWQVRVSVRDIFGKNAYTGSVIPQQIVPVASELVFMDWDQSAGIGLNKYHSLGFLDVGGDIYMNGNKVVDLSALASAADVVAETSAAKFLAPSNMPTIFPAGCTLDFAGAVAPGGFLICDGSAVSRTTYARLYAVIGTTYGVGDGSTTFNLPDARGRGTVGYQSGDADFGTLGAKPGAKTAAHTHTLSDNGQAGFSATTGIAYLRRVASAVWTHTHNFTASGFSSDTSTSSSGLGLNGATDSGSASTIQPGIVLNKIIKT